MKKNILANLVYTTILTAMATSANASQELKCPTEIKVQSKVQNIPKDWHSWDNSEEGKNAIKILSSVRLYEGHPDKKILLNPDTSVNKENFVTWTFSPDREKGKSPIWISCAYQDTEVVIVKSLSPKFKKCRMDLNVEKETKKTGTVTCE